LPSPIKIVHVMEAVIGGTQRHLLDLALGLSPNRFEQHLVVSLERSPQFAEHILDLEARGVSIDVLPMQRAIAPLADHQALIKLVQILKELQPDIVHGHSAKGGFLARLAAARAGIPHTIYTPHIFPFQMRISLLRRWLYLALERYAASLTDFIIAVSNSERQAAIRAGLTPRAEVVLIANGIDAANYGRLPNHTRQRVRRDLGVTDNTVLIGAVGDLRPQKGYDILLKATALLAESGRTVRVVIAGEGSLRHRLERMIASLGLSETVELLGECPDVPRLLGALDLFVMPSLYEGCPYALVEAMAAGVPVVATAVPGIIDIIEAGETGSLATPSVPASIAEQLANALDDYEKSQEMAARARRVVEDQYDRERMLNQTAQLYQRCGAGA